MKLILKAAALFTLIAGTIAHPARLYAWGKDGHQIVAEIAMQQLSDGARQNLTALLGTTTPEEASTWMDDMRQDAQYNFMKPLHYINIDKGAAYQPTTEENIITEMLRAYRELKHRNTLCSDQAKKDVMTLFHLAGDLHQPLHSGYGTDRGGNMVHVTFNGKTTNLHWLWDDELIQQQHIGLNDCRQLYSQLSAEEVRRIKTIDFIKWMSDARALLSQVYDFPDSTISTAYAAKNKALIVQQLLYAGLRLGAAMEQLFHTDETTAVTKQEPVPTGTQLILMPQEASLHEGEEVTVCGKVYGAKYLDRAKGNPTFINMGARYPDSPFTVVIFGSDRDKFPYKPETYFDSKSICVTGRVKMYKGKAEIVVSRPDKIVVQ